MLAITRSVSPQRRQVAMAKTRLSRCAQVIERCRWTSALAAGCSPEFAGRWGTTRARSAVAVATTPRYRVRCARGFGTSAASRDFAAQCLPGRALGLHVVEMDITFDPIPVGAFRMDGKMTPSHEVAHFVTRFCRHTNPRGLDHAWSLVSRGGERLRAMIFNTAALPETGSTIVLSSAFACQSVVRRHTDRAG